YAADESEEYIPWTLPHVIAHFTASSEESAFLAAELARGVKVSPHRSRWETPWEEFTTIEECNHRV
ncbi:MAG: DinB family protein, partial [Chloroflexota bacterium]